MASGGAADPGAQPPAPPAPPAPSEGKKSRKKRKEKLEAVDDAQEGGDEMEGLRRAGGRALGDVQEAVGCCRGALLFPGGTAAPQLHRGFAFNLGATYMEMGKPKKDLEFLLQSRPSEGGGRGHRGELDLEGGAAPNFPKALEYFGGGGSAGGAGGRAGTQVRVGRCHLGMREPTRATRRFLEVVHGYLAEVASPEVAAMALSRASTSMLQSRSFGAAEIAGVLAQCRSLCRSIPDPALRGKLYNDIGLGYSQLRIFSLATESFQRALEVCSQEQDRRGEAAALQNLGAAHNALRSFGSALGWHRRAAALHGSLGNRRAQGQCFGNLGYACSRLGKHQAAVENYLHALQAFRDTGDVQGQWQACEGLGSACFHLGHPQKAIGHYKEALTLLSRCQDTPRAARERVVHKLTQAIQHQLCPHGHGGVRPPAPDPGRLRFRPTLPHASRTRLRGSEVSFGGKAQPGDKLEAPAPAPHPGRSDTRAVPADGPTLKPQDPRGHLDISGEDEDGPSAAPGSHSQPHANGNLRTTHPCPAPPRHRPRHRGHQPPRRRPPERHPTPHNALLASLSSSPTASPTAKPRARSRTLSLICSLV